MSSASEQLELRMAPYIEGRCLFVDWCSVLPLSVPVEFGTIGCPGLSDIDIGVVFKRGFDPANYDIQGHLKQFPKEISLLMNGGTLMFFPEEVFEYILYIDDIQLNCLCDPIHVRQITSSEKYLVDLIQIIEWLPERLAKIYLEIEKDDPNIKRLIGFFYSLCYSLDKVQKIAHPDNFLSDFIIQVRGLRDKWFSLSAEEITEEVEHIASIYIDIISVAVRRITPVLQKYFALTGDIGYNLHSNINIVGNQSMEMGIARTGNNLCINIPSVFLNTYLRYSKHDSKLGSIIANRLRDNTLNVEISKEMDDVLSRRIDVCSGLFDFVKALGCNSGLYKFGWYIND